MTDISGVCDKAIEILRRTNDGEDLAPHHLYLLQCAVNSFLNKDGDIAFEELYQQVLKGYKKPWFCGVDNLTFDHQGYVSWKGVIVEHFSTRNMTVEEINTSARNLEYRCRHLEGIGVRPDYNTVIWYWESYRPKDDEKKE